ncbi:MAG: NfeD family protein [Verrucomicrobiae bacterium]|nr:NfeD family protein [Verrucomicrobiae bacterium]
MSLIIFLSVVGIILFCLEMFLPGAVMGILGGLCLLTAVIITTVKFGIAAGSFAFVGLLIASGIGLALWLYILPRSRMGAMVVTGQNLADSKSADSVDHFLNQTGKTITPLRPSGTALINGKRVDVQAESGFIERDCEIAIVKIEGSRIVARKL